MYCHAPLFFLWRPIHTYFVCIIFGTARVNWVFSCRAKTKSTTITITTTATTTTTKKKNNDHDNNRSLCAWFNVIANGWIFKRYTWCFDQRRMFIENTFSKWNYSLFLAHNGWFQEKPAQYYTIKINNNISVVAVKSVPPKCMIEKSYRQNQIEERKKEFLKTHYNRQCFICSISIGLSLYDWNAFYPAGIIQPFNEKKERQSGHWTMDMDRKTNVKWTWA